VTETATVILLIVTVRPLLMITHDDHTAAVTNQTPSESGPPLPGGQAPWPGGQAPRPGGQAPWPGGQAPRPGGQAPRPGGQAPWPGGAGRRGKTLLAVGAGVATLLVLCCGGAAVVGALTGGPPAAHPVAGDQRGGAPDAARPAGQSAAEPAAAGPDGSAGPDESAGPSAAAAPEPSAPPEVVTRTVTETRSIPFTTRTVRDSSLPKGTTRVRTKGVPGVRTLTYQVTVVNGVQTAKKLLREQVTRQPVSKVVAVGTKTPACDPNYTGACVPIASDVDCAGGGGNGPAYVQGPVTVVGTDIYHLDSDGDGIGCE
jgi:resuscitation-promoting factor RpfB